MSWDAMWTRVGIFDHPAVVATILRRLPRTLPRYDPIIHDNDPDSLESQLLEQHRHRAVALIEFARGWSKAPGPFVFFDYALSPALNAFAFFCQYNRCGYICFNTGTIPLIYDLFYRLLSHPDIFGKILDASVEKVRDPFHSQGLLRNYNDLLSGRPRGSGKLRDIIPHDPRRRRYADRLAEIAIDYLVLHEFCHILHGHCQVLSPVGFLSEIQLQASGTVGVSPDDALSFQAVERDADAFATYNTWIKYANKRDRDWEVTRADLDALRGVRPLRELVTKDWATAIHGLFELMGLGFDPAGYETSLHPPTQIRYLTTQLDVIHLIGESDKESAKIVEGYLMSAWAELRMMLDRMNHPIPDLRAFYRMQDDGTLNIHLKAVGQRWLELVPKLAEHSYSHLTGQPDPSTSI